MRAPRHGLTGVLRRRPEAYHDALRKHDAQLAASGAASDAVSDDAAADAADGAASIHEHVWVKESGLSAHLVYDDYERRSGLVRILPADATPDVVGSRRTRRARRSRDRSLPPGAHRVRRGGRSPRRLRDGQWPDVRAHCRDAHSARRGSQQPDADLDRRPRKSGRRGTRGASGRRVGDHHARRRRQSGRVVGDRR